MNITPRIKDFPVVIQRSLRRGVTLDVTDDDWVVICLDYAQLELRVCALFCQDPAMTRILTDPKGDMHQNTADEVGVVRDPSAKNMNFLLIYGGQSYVLSELLTINGVPTTQDQSGAYILRWNGVYERVPARRHELLDEHPTKGFVQLFTGRKRWLLDADWNSRRGLHKIETTLSNNTVQGSGQDFLKMSIIRSDPHCINVDRILPTKMEMPNSHKLLLRDYAVKVDKWRKTLRAANCNWLLQVHDEALWLTRRSAAPECIDILAKMMVMRHPFPSIKPYTIPLVVDGGWAENWKSAKAKGNENHVTCGFKEWEELQ